MIAPRSTAARTARAISASQKASGFAAADLEIEAAVIDGADLDPQAALAGVDRPAPEPGHRKEAHALDLYQSIVRPSPSANETPAV